MKLLNRNILIIPEYPPQPKILLSEEDPTPLATCRVAEVSGQILDIKVDDILHYNNRMGTFVTVDDVEYILIDYNDVYFIY